MKKILTTLLSVACAAMMLCNSAAFAHSGRTDSSGGHRDNKNKSGLGYYHYHCGGYPAHLHTNGVCPYRSGGSRYTSSAPTSASSVSASRVAYTPPKPVYRILGTSMRTFINGKQIATYHYNGNPSTAVVVAEELEHYGYDIKWVDEWKTLYITRNYDKEINGMSVPATYDGEYISDVVDTDATIRLVYGDGNSYVPVSYSLGKKMIIPVEELKCLGTYRYNSVENTIYIN